MYKALLFACFCQFTFLSFFLSYWSACSMFFIYSSATLFPAYLSSCHIGLPVRCFLYNSSATLFPAYLSSCHIGLPVRWFLYLHFSYPFSCLSVDIFCMSVFCMFESHSLHYKSLSHTIWCLSARFPTVSLIKPTGFCVFPISKCPLTPCTIRGLWAAESREHVENEPTHH